MSAISDFEQKLLQDPNTRRAFAQNPKKFIDELGIKLPPNTKVPDQIPLNEIEDSVKRVQQTMAEHGVGLPDPHDSTAVAHFVGEAIPVTNSDLRVQQAVHEAYQSAARIPGGPGDAATVAVLGAVVAVVVAVPAAVYGKSAQDFAQYVNVARGVEGISRVGGRYVLHGPGGLRVENLDAHGITTIIKGLR